MNSLIETIEWLIEENSSYKGLVIALEHTLEEVKILESVNKNAEKSRILKESKISKKLHIWSWLHYIEWFYNIDCYGRADLFYDIRCPIPLDDAWYDLIFSEHTLEHLDYPLAVNNFFAECYRLLEKWGRLIVWVPDTELIINTYISKDWDLYEKFIKNRYKNRDLNNFKTYIDLLNYHMRDEISSKIYTPHLWSYDFEKLNSLWLEYGFDSCSRIDFPREYANPKREFWTIYVEYIK